MITPGEIQKGMFVTVHHWEREQFESGESGWLGTGQIITVPVLDNSCKGEILEVLSVALPFISAKRWFTEKLSSDPFTLDTRAAVLMELPDEFVESIRGTMRKQ